MAILDQELAAAKEGIARLKSRIKDKDIAIRDLSEERANFVMPTYAQDALQQFSPSSDLT